jgi:hypothetical protein
MGLFNPELTDKEIGDRLAAPVRDATAARQIAPDDREAILIRMGCRPGVALDWSAERAPGWEAMGMISWAHGAEMGVLCDSGFALFALG